MDNLHLHETEMKALELLALAPEPVGGEFDAAFRRLVALGLAERTFHVWAITEAGCEYLAQFAPMSSIPRHDAPCGYIRIP